MVRIIFNEDIQKQAVCKSTDSAVIFKMNGEPFRNRKFRFCGKALLFDGYSVWFEDMGEGLKPENDFSISFLAAPLGYSSRGDGLFSFFDREKSEGFYLLITKQGKIQVGFGNGKQVYTFDSIGSRVQREAWNIIMVVFWQEAGWCDLYLNGTLSNRKQFPRHMAIKWPQSKAFLGKYTDHTEWGREKETGCFYGLMEEVLIHDCALRKEQVKELHEAYPAGKKTEKILPDRNDYEEDPQRPKYHLIPSGKWMNEPHAPFYYQGYYHIFYQANPHAPIWDHIQWGHMVSRDMVHWEDLPPALTPEDQDLDPDGCWSGSSVVDKQGIPHIFYTAGNNSCFPNQFVAEAQAVTDKEKRLPVWKKKDKPVVLQTKGWLGEFRDPFVWLEDDTYFMLVGTGDENNGGGNAVLYSSEDLKNWRCHDFFLDYEYERNKEMGHVFELPVLLPLKDEEGNTACHIFIVCGCQIEGERVENLAFLGKWDPKNRSFQKFHDRALLLDLGNGVFTGPSGFVTPDSRSVVFSIAQGMRKENEEYYAGWAHNGGIPIELSVKDKELRIRPVSEIYGLRKKRLLHLTDITLKEAREALDAFEGNMFFMKVKADASELSIETGDRELKRRIYFDRQQERFGVRNEKGEEIGKYRGDADRVDIGKEPVSMEYFLDHSMIEVYLNDRKSITARNYVRAGKRKISLDGTVNRIYELELWEMNSAYQDSDRI